MQLATVQYQIGWRGFIQFTRIWTIRIYEEGRGRVPSGQIRLVSVNVGITYITAVLLLNDQKDCKTFYSALDLIYLVYRVINLWIQVMLSKILTVGDFIMRNYVSYISFNIEGVTEQNLWYLIHLSYLNDRFMSST